MALILFDKHYLSLPAFVRMGGRLCGLR